MILLPSELLPSIRKVVDDGDDERRSFDYKEFAALVGTRGTKNERLWSSLSENKVVFFLSAEFSQEFFGEEFSRRVSS
jgi:hypothetical protein